MPSIYYLYVKTHRKAGLKYLGITSKIDPYSYSGSGTRWTRHLKKHGYDFTTTVIGTFTNKRDLKRVGLFWSTVWDVIKSPEWANLTEEAGYGGPSRLGIPVPPQVKRRIIKSCSGKIPWNKGKIGIYSEETLQRMRKPKSEEAKRNISAAALKRPPRSKETIENHRAKLLGRKRTEETKLLISEGQKRYWTSRHANASSNAVGA